MRSERYTKIVLTVTRSGPLRWRVPAVAERDGDRKTDDECHTVFSILNVAPTDIEVEIAIHSQDNVFVAGATRTVAPDTSHTFMTATSGISFPGYPFTPPTALWTDHLRNGFGHVWADDPRIIAAAFLICTENFTSIDDSIKHISPSTIPIFPVGATAQFFHAGMPATWTPPMAAPEVPE